MDLYRAYLDSRRNATADQNSPQNQLMGHIVQLRQLLDKNGDRNQYYFYLRQLSKCLYHLGQQGEAYKALSLLPPDQIGDLDGLISIYEHNVPDQTNMTIEIITKCNLRCPLCVGGGDKRSDYDKLGRRMSLDDFKTIWDRVRDYTGLAILVGLGETFLHPQVYEIIEYIDKPIHIDTNGNVPLDHERVARSNVSHLIFSIDGIDQRTYEKYRVGGHFSKAVQNLEQMVAAKRRLGRGPVITFKYIVFKHNEMYVRQAADLARQIGVDHFQVSECGIGLGTDWELARQFIPCGKNAVSRIECVDYKNNVVYPRPDLDSPHCTATFNNSVVCIDGSVRPCCGSNHDRVFGNLFEKSFLEIWKSESYKNFRLETILNKFKFSDCRFCLMPNMTLGTLFDGTELEYTKRGRPSDDSLYIRDIGIDEDYAKSLNEYELQYFIDSNKWPATAPPADG